MIDMTLREAAAILGVSVHGGGAGARFHGCGTDSRRIEAGTLFIAIRGERFDGHDFVDQVAASGAAGALVEAGWLPAATPAPDPDFALIPVPDSLVGFGALASAWRRRFDLPVVAITGSNGKTSVKEMVAAIAGQAATITRAKKSIAAFKLREGTPIGCRVTLRGQQMWDFLDRLLLVALPRTRDFRGVSRKAFDGRGNYTLGIKEILIFPEVDIEKLNAVPGMNICIHTSAITDDEGRALLGHLGMPFRQ